MIEARGVPRPNRQRPSRRDELLSVAADLFAERGFAKVTVDDIGNAVGLSGPALYHHFDGKESLLGEMLVRISESLLAKATAIVDNVSLRDALDPIIAMHVDFAVDNRSLITVHFRDLVQARKSDQRRVKDLQSAYVDIWVDIVDAQHTRRARHQGGARRGARRARPDQLHPVQRSSPPRRSRRRSCEPWRQPRSPASSRTGRRPEAFGAARPLRGLRVQTLADGGPEPSQPGG